MTEQTPDGVEERTAVFGEIGFYVRGTPLVMRWEAALAVDVDVIDDLRELTARRVGPATAEWLMRHRASMNVRLTAGGVS